MDLEGSETGKSVKVMSRKELYNIIKECPDKLLEKKIVFMENRLFEFINCSDEDRGILRRKLRHFKSDFKRKWTAACNKEGRFLNDNKKWLAGSIQFTMRSVQRTGRPKKEFQELSERSRRRKCKGLREQASAEELIYAAQMSFRATGKNDASAIAKQITSSPGRASKIRKAVSNSTETLVRPQLTPIQALTIFVEADLSKRQYEIIRSADKKLYPCYSVLKRAKNECYPNPETYRVTETCAEIKLQDLLDHTISRLCKYLEEVIDGCTEKERHNLELISKWGCDGSQQAQFKQKFQNDIDTDANIFQSSFVPLRLSANINGTKTTIGQNPVPSSPRYCRPIRVRFIHETVDVTKDEINYVENEIKNLNKTEILTTSGVLYIKHILLPTMVDAKVCNAATATSPTMRCYLCGATSKDFNNLSKKKEVDPNTLKFGLSILHARIRFFESLLHLAYKIPIRKWQARTAAEKELVIKRKERIQESFKQEMGLRVDIPKAGFGNTNDGNTSRRFFSDPETSARITGVDLNLLNKFKVILEVISSGHKINVENFSKFTFETAQLYVSLYSWHPMSPTMHKILIHGPTVVAHAILPIGQLSEEAAEARNKHFRQYRQGFARKFSRISCNRDVVNRLLLSSDPLLSSLRSVQRKKSKPFSSDALELLLPAEKISVTSEEYAAHKDLEEDSDYTSDEEN